MDKTVLKGFINKLDKLKSTDERAYRNVLEIVSDRWYFEVAKQQKPTDYETMEELLAKHGG